MTWWAILICCVVGAISLPFVVVIWITAIDHISMIFKKRKLMRDMEKNINKMFSPLTKEEQRKQFFDDLERIQKQIEEDKHDN